MVLILIDIRSLVNILVLLVTICMNTPRQVAHSRLSPLTGGGGHTHDCQGPRRAPVLPRIR